MKDINEIATLALAVMSILIFPAVREHWKLTVRMSSTEQSVQELQRKLHEEIAASLVLRESYASISKQLAVLTERIENMNKAIVSRDEWMEKVVDLLTSRESHNNGR